MSALLVVGAVALFSLVVVLGVLSMTGTGRPAYEGDSEIETRLRQNRKKYNTDPTGSAEGKWY